MEGNLEVRLGEGSTPGLLLWELSPAWLMCSQQGPSLDTKGPVYFDKFLRCFWCSSRFKKPLVTSCCLSTKSSLGVYCYFQVDDIKIIIICMLWKSLSVFKTISKSWCKWEEKAADGGKAGFPLCPFPEGIWCRLLAFECSHLKGRSQN